MDLTADDEQPPCCGEVHRPPELSLERKPAGDVRHLQCDLDRGRHDDPTGNEPPVGIYGEQHRKTRVRHGYGHTTEHQRGCRIPDRDRAADQEGDGRPGCEGRAPAGRPPCDQHSERPVDDLGDDDHREVHVVIIPQRRARRQWRAARHPLGGRLGVRFAAMKPRRPRMPEGERGLRTGSREITKPASGPIAATQRNTTATRDIARRFAAPTATIASHGRAANAKSDAADVNSDEEPFDDGLLGSDVGPRRGDVAVEHCRALGETGCAREDPSPGRDDPERSRDPRSQCIRRPDHRGQPDSRDDQCDARRSPQKDEDHSSSEVRGHVRGRRQSRVVDDGAERLVDGEGDEEGDREAECSPACDAKRSVHDVSFREVPGRVPGDLSEQHRFPGPPGSSLPGCDARTHRQPAFRWRSAGMSPTCSSWGQVRRLAITSCFWAGISPMVKRSCASDGVVCS